MNRQLTEPPQTTLALALGREAELKELSLLFQEESPISVLSLHGIPGIGKSTVLSALSVAASDLRGAGSAGPPKQTGVMVTIDCRTIEPTESGFVDELAALVGAEDAELSGTVERLAGLAPVVVLALDHFEVFRLMDTWLRQVFVAAMPSSVRMILCGKQPLVAAWLIAPELEGKVRSISLGPLDEETSICLFHRYQVPEQSAKSLNRIVRGHPLAIKLAASTVAERPDLALQDVAAHRAVEELTSLYLAEVDNPLSRRALEAAACVRRVTRPLLNSMLPDAPASAFDHMAQLPFIESRSDGLIVHEAVREAVASSLRASDPARYRKYRRAAWRQLKGELKEAGDYELWRYTSDMLYMIENPVVREAFFPSAAQPLATEPARPGDLSAIEALSERHDGPEATALLREWWTSAPETFSVVRDRDGVVTGFFYLLDSAHMMPPKVTEDPVVDTWRRHLRDHPIPQGQLVLGFRRWLDYERGELPCATQAASWLDVKRTYMQLRPKLRRIYVVVQDVATYWPIVEKLGFRPLSSAGDDFHPVEPQPIGAVNYSSVVLDFGPGSVDGWLARLVAAELGVGQDPVDEASHELVIDGERVGLTPLEFGMLKCLDANAGKAMSRARLLEEVWGYEFTGESNVVNMVITTLRHKLGPHAEVIRTIRGVGYRLEEDWKTLLA